PLTPSCSFVPPTSIPNTITDAPFVSYPARLVASAGSCDGAACIDSRRPILLQASTAHTKRVWLRVTVVRFVPKPLDHFRQWVFEHRQFLLPLGKLDQPLPTARDESFSLLDKLRIQFPLVKRAFGKDRRKPRI